MYSFVEFESLKKWLVLPLLTCRFLTFAICESQMLENLWGNPLVSPIETKSFHFQIMIFVCITDIPDLFLLLGTLGLLPMACPQ